MSTTSVVFVPQGSIGQIISYLHQRNFALIPNLDKVIVRFFGWPQSGWVDIGVTKLSRADFFHRLTHAKAAMTSITLIPGQTTVQFFEHLSKTFNLSPVKLMEAYLEYSPYPEGLLFPETYHLPMGIKERHLAYYLVSLSEVEHKELSHKIFAEYNPRKWYRYLIVASIIEKEAASTEEMPLVSSVIYNRLKKNMKLQMDGTLNYGAYGNQKVTPERIKNDTSRYNTYKYAGLPPHPVATVSKDAIRAAIFPAQTDYFYFVRNKKGVHTFSKTYKEHQLAIQKNR